MLLAGSMQQTELGSVHPIQKNCSVLLLIQMQIYITKIKLQIEYTTDLTFLNKISLKYIIERSEKQVMSIPVQLYIVA